jgi:hypothetical protein
MMLRSWSCDRNSFMNAEVVIVDGGAIKTPRVRAEMLASQ